MSGSLFVPANVGALQPFVDAGVFGPTEVHAVATYADATVEATVDVLVAIALAVRAPLHGHVCVDLESVQDTVVTGLDSSTGMSAELSTESSAVVPPDAPDLPWPAADGWADRVSESPLVKYIDGSTDGVPSAVTPEGELAPFVMDGGRLYLTRYWTLERYVAADLLARSAHGKEQAPGSGGPGETDEARIRTASMLEVQRLFEASDGPVDRDQLAAALAGIDRELVVISGGPGTGKTTTVARFLAGLVSALEQTGSDRGIALVAPTGKAAARMTEAIRQAVKALVDVLDPDVVERINGLEATTVHRLLGSTPRGGYRHGPESPLPHDVVIVDEVSMVSLSLMAHLLAAIRADATVLLVGDPYQLASVEAGAVLGDIVGLDPDRAALAGSLPPERLRGNVQVLGTVHRQDEGSKILDLATAVRTGDTEKALSVLRGGHSEVRWVDPTVPEGKSDLAVVASEVTSIAVEAVDAARENRIDEALDSIGRVKVLCAHRRGPDGVEGWNQRITGRLQARGLIGVGDWYAGRPVMVTENDRLNGVFNGDVGVAVRCGDRFEVWFPRAAGNQMVESARLDRITTQWAMTVHKSQGSEFAHVVLCLPDPSSRILTRELLYTALTRAKGQLTIVASVDSVRAAIGRPVGRASGLAARLGPVATNAPTA